MEKYEVLYKGLPKCYLLDALYKKSIERYDIDFDFLGTINRIRQRVSAEVSQINRLFPEYTPHDDDYHIKRLFNVADTVLGKKLIESMNSTELLILSCGLYCHDWGMAVSESEKEFVINLGDNRNCISDDFWLIDNEKDIFEQFLQQCGVKRSVSKDSTQINDDIWRDYVRQTHALRSGKRAFQFFEKDDIGLANSVAKVCVGHWLDFKDVRKYSPNYTVLNETVNLRALAIYIRLIDLLDITNYRTPYVIWKYVAPKNPYSKMEWNKHRAIQSLSSREYQQGRAIQIDGITSDHEVYASLEDMKEWCDEQFRGCNDLLAEMNDSRHRFDIYHIDWKIETSGFKPTKIRFEFDREKMFGILAEEIYQNDSYVFLRELLQNSIDAIRMRRAVLKDKGIECNNIGVIKVEVEHLDKGDAIISWTDDGVGMNEHIIKNYLAVAGKSYYSSDEFKNEGLNIDPISRFGVGILSCFGVADKIDIETRREPYIDSNSALLNIVIPSVTKHFRVEHRININGFVGTKVKVYVNGKRIFKDDEAELKDRLNVTKYLKIVAGFVEFPIIIQENKLKTIIVHPRSDEKVIQDKYGIDHIVHKLNMGYPWEEIFLPQELSLSKEIFSEQNCDVAKLLEGEGYEGAITYIHPRDEEMELVPGWSEHDSKSFEVVYRRKSKVEMCKKVRINDIGYMKFDSKGFCKSCKTSPFYSVYRDGILISEVELPKQFYNRRYFSVGDMTIPPRIIVNIPKSKTQKIDLARIHILGKAEQWDKPIKAGYINGFLGSKRNALLECNPIDRIHKMGRLSAYNNIFPSDLWEYLTHDDWPILTVQNRGQVCCHDYKELKENEIYKLPDILEDELEENIYKKLYVDDNFNCILQRWGGDKCFITLSGYGRSDKSLSFSFIKYICSMPLFYDFQFSSIRFLTSPFEREIPLLQEVWKRCSAKKENNDKEAILIRAYESPQNLTDVEKVYMLNNLRYNYEYHIPEIVEFSKPFNKCFSYGFEAINFLHPIGQAFVRIIAFLESDVLKSRITVEQLGCLIDCLRKLPNYRSNYSYSNLISSLRQIWLKVNELRLFDIKEIDELLPKPDSFIPGTLIAKGDDYNLLDKDTLKRMKRIKKEFGVTIE